MRHILLSLLLLVTTAFPCMAQTTNAVTNTASTLTTTSEEIIGTDFLDQGECADLHQGNTNSYSTRSCPGDSTNMLTLEYPSQTECVYINNATTHDFFVPLRTLNEWTKFKENLPKNVSLVYGCPVETKTLCNGKYTASLPAAPNLTPKDVNYGTGKVMSYRCDAAAAGCGSWVETGPEECTTPVDGACGAANGLSVSAPPASGLCSTGTASGVAGTGPFIWSCAGADGGNTAACSAPLACTPTSKVTPTDFVMLIDASGSMDQTVADAKKALSNVVNTYLASHSEIKMAVNAIGGDGYSPQISAGSFSGYNNGYSSGGFHGGLFGSSGNYGKVYALGVVNPSAVNTAVGKLTAVGSTPLAEALDYSQSILATTSNRHVLLVLTDGKETAQTKVDPASVITKIRAAGTLVYGIQYITAAADSNFSIAPFFGNMNAYAVATSQDGVLQAIKSIVNDTVIVGCGNTAGVPVNGKCGASGGITTLTAPTGNFCDVGIASAVTGSGPWTWTCNGGNGGTSIWCSANLPIIDAVCGAADGTVVSSKPTVTTDLCEAGNAGTVTGGSGGNPWDWTCAGIGGGLDATCSAMPPPLDGVCGSATSAAAASTAPGSNLCSAGKESSVSLDASNAKWKWVCNGLYGSNNNASCAANAKINGACGSANGAAGSSNPPNNNLLCNAGVASTVTGHVDPKTHNVGKPWNWTCQGIGSGATSATCKTK